MPFFSFFDAERLPKIFRVPAETVRKIHGRKVVSLNRVASLTELERKTLLSVNW